MAEAKQTPSGTALAKNEGSEKKVEAAKQDPNVKRTYHATDLFFFKGKWNRTGQPVEATPKEALFHLLSGRLVENKPDEKTKGPAETKADEQAEADKKATKRNQAAS